jgi:hypothetical protein
MRRFQKQTLDADSQAITPKVRAVTHVTVVVKELEGYARKSTDTDRIRVRGSGQGSTLLSESMSGVISPTTMFSALWHSGLDGRFRLGTGPTMV